MERRTITRKRLLAAGWLLLLGLTASLPLSALFHGVFHVGPGTLVVASPPTRPLVSFGSDVILPAGSKNIVVSVLGDVQVHGRARDDVVAVGGRIYLHAGARVDRDALAVIGGIYKARGVTVDGRLGGALHLWNGRRPRDRHDFLGVLGTSIRLGLAAGLALLLAGTCLTIVFPWQVVLISTTLRSAPLKSGAAGAMSLLTFTFLVVPLGLSLAGLPFALLLTAAASLAWLFGMTASAVLVGRILTHGPVPLLWAAAAGLVLLALTMAIPVIGPLMVTLVGLLGAGALAVALVSRARPAAPLA